jgi:hypothetical protein
MRVVGERRLIQGGDSGQIVDLAEQTVYDLDFKKKTYTAATFAELKQRFEEERAKAEQEAQKAREQQASKQAGQTGQDAGRGCRSTSRSRRRPRAEIAGHEASW